MNTTRRAIITGSVAAVVQLPAVPARAASYKASAFEGPGIDARTLGVRAGGEDQSRQFGKALNAAADRSMPLVLPPGDYCIADVSLPNNVHVVGIAGASRLVHAGRGAMLRGRGGARLVLEGIELDGQKRPSTDTDALVVAENVDALSIMACTFRNAGWVGISTLACRGRIADCLFLDVGNAAIFSLDARGLAITGNAVERCGNNGIQIWRSSRGDDGTMVTGNRLVDIRADSGGDGPYGNAISVFRADNVLVSGNHISGCAFSAVRGNSASNIQILGSSAQRLGEVALYSEFAFEGAIVANNLVDGASIGISVTNFNEGGRLSVVQGNVLRNLVTGRPATTVPEDVGGIGIGIEADCAVTGNSIDNTTTAGIAVGFGSYLRNVTVTGNMVRKAGAGVMVSVSRGAGSALIAHNVFAETTRGAVVGTDHVKVVTGDLTRSSREHPQLRIVDNLVS